MKTLVRRSLAMLLVLLIMLSVPIQALAAEWDLNNGDITVNTGDAGGQHVSQTGGSSGYDDAPVISGSGNVTVTGDGEANVTIKGDSGTDSKVDVKVEGNVSASEDGAIKVESGNVNVDLTEGGIIVDEDNSAGVVVGDANVTINGGNDNKNDIGVSGDNSTGVLVSGDNANVTLDGTGVIANGKDSSGVTIEGENAQVTLKDSKIYSNNGNAVSIKGNTKNGNVRLTLNNTYIQAWENGGSGIDINSDGVLTTVEAASYKLGADGVETNLWTPASYELTQNLIDVNTAAAGVFTRPIDLQSQGCFDAYYTIAAADLTDYKDAAVVLGTAETNVHPSFTVMEEKVDLDNNGVLESRYYIQYTVENTAFIKALYDQAVLDGTDYDVEPVLLKTVYLDITDKAVDVTIDLKGDNTVIVTDEDDHSANDNCGDSTHNHSWTGYDDPDEGWTTDDGNYELGISHAAIHVSDDNLTITSEEEGTLHAEVTDPHYCHWDHDVYSGITAEGMTWLAYSDSTAGYTTHDSPCPNPVNVSYVRGVDADKDGYYEYYIYYTRIYCAGHEDHTDLASAAAIGTNSVLTSAARSEGAGGEYISGDPIAHGRTEDLTGSITISGNAKVNAYAAQDQHEEGPEDKGYAGAAIGTGYGGSVVGSITIKDSAVVYGESSYGAGIGAGQLGDITASGSINVQDNASATGTSDFGVSAGIGAGQNGDLAGSINVSNNAYANGTSISGAGIGAGVGGSLTGNGSINVSGAATAAGKSTSGAGIGAGSGGAMKDNSSINIDAKTVVGASNSGAGIGGGANGGMEGASAINIGGSTTVSTVSVTGAGIGGGANGGLTGLNAIVVGGSAAITSTSNSGAAIGSGSNAGIGADASITIGDSATIRVTSTSGAGIGTGEGGNLSGSISILDDVKVVGADQVVVAENTQTREVWVYDVLVNGVKTQRNVEFAQEMTDDPATGTTYVFRNRYEVSTTTSTVINTVGANSVTGAGIGTGAGGTMTDAAINISAEQVFAESGSGAAIGTGAGAGMSNSVIDIDDTEVARNEITTTMVITKELKQDGTFVSATREDTITTRKLLAAISTNGGAGVGTGAGGDMVASSISTSGALVQAWGNSGAAIGTGAAGDLNESSYIELDDTRMQLYAEVVTNTYNKSYREDILPEEFILNKTIFTEAEVPENYPIPQSISGAAIGTGAGGNLDGDITLKNETIADVSSGSGAAIGSGQGGRQYGDITIDSSTVTAHSTTGAGIGMGANGTEAIRGDITIQGDSLVLATSDTNAAIGTNTRTEMVATAAAEGAYVRIEDMPLALQEKAKVDVTIQEGGNGEITRYHLLTAAELKQIQMEADKVNFPDYAPVNPFGNITRYDVTIPTISILDNAVVHTTQKTENVTIDDFGVIGVAEPSDDTIPVGLGRFNHVYKLSAKATIDGVKNASLNYLAEFMNLFFDENRWTNIFWEGKPSVDDGIGEIIYWVTEHDDLDILMDHEDETENGVLTVVAEQDDACFVTYRGGLIKLRERGVKTIIFKSGDTVSEFDVDVAIAAYTTGHLVICHDGGNVTFTIGGEAVEGVLKEQAD